MIILRFTSGLGNQMFQYNLYSTLRERFGKNRVKADLTWFDRFSEHQGYELERIFGGNGVFEIDAATDSEITKCSGRIPNHVKGKAGEAWQFILRIPHRLIRTFDSHERIRIEQTGFEDNKEIFRQIEAIDPQKDYYITGFFIEEIYYKERLTWLQDCFSFDEPSDDRNREYLDQIDGCNSVSIHVRRGDYLSPEYASSFLSLGDDYYRQAISLMKEKYDNPRFFIFSDDKDYIEKAFEHLEDKVIVTGNDGQNSFRDMQLMSRCRSNIIANSTFSVWAALLNSNKDKTVIYPSAYMNEKDTQQMTLPGWVRI